MSQLVAEAVDRQRDGAEHSTAMTLMSVAAPAVGGILYEWIQPEGVYFVVTVMMLPRDGDSPASCRSCTQTTNQLRAGKNLRTPQYQAWDSGIRGAKPPRNSRCLLTSICSSLRCCRCRSECWSPFLLKSLYGSIPSEVGWLATMAGIGWYSRIGGRCEFASRAESRLGNSDVTGDLWRFRSFVIGLFDAVVPGSG